MIKVRESNKSKTHLFRAIGRDMYRKLESVIKEDLKKIKEEIIQEVTDDIIKNDLRIELLNNENL